MDARPRRHPPAADPHARRVRERDRRGRRHRRLDERRPAPARDRPRGGRTARARGLRLDRRPHADRRRPEAGRPLRRDRPVRGRRRRRSSRASSSAPAWSTADARGVDGRTLGEVGAGVEETPGQDVVVSLGDPAEADRRPRDPARLARARGAVVKLAGHERLLHRGPARVFDSEEECFAAVKARAIRARRRGRDPLRGPGGRPGDARDAPRDRGARRRGHRRRRRADHRRPLLGRDARPDGRHIAPEAFRGGPLAAVRDGDTIVLDVEARRLDLEIPAEELEAASPPGRRRRRATRAASSPSTRPRSARPPKGR